MTTRSPFTSAVGGLSLLSGGLLILWPLPMARLYGFPERRALVRPIGVRDIVAGVMLLRGGSPRAWLSVRAASDAADAVLIAATAARSPRAAVFPTLGRLLVALASVVVCSTAALDRRS